MERKGIIMKQRNKKVLALLLATALAASAAPTAFAVQPIAAAAPVATGLSGAEESGKWYYGEGWEYNYSGAAKSSVVQEDGMVKATVDFHADADKDYSKMAVSHWNDDGIQFEDTTQVSFDFYYDEAKMTKGGFKIAVNSDVLNVNDTPMDLGKAETVEGTLKKLPVTLECDAANGSVNGVTFCIIGVNTDYTGELWLDNIRFVSVQGPDVYVDAKEKAATKTALAATASALNVNGKDYAYATDIQLADPQASASAVALYQYLQTVGKSDGALYGHMEDTVLKAGAAELSDSDTKDMTGSLSAINGFDCGGLFDGFAEKYNKRHPDKEPLAQTTEGDIKAAALLTNEAMADGAIMTISCHMPNFAFATEKNASADKTYDRYDYTKADSYNLNGDCMNQILPGGKFHAQFTAFLDLVAEYAKQVDGAVLFRPFHENTGSWFWWGKAFCDAQTYQGVYRYTVEYLRDEKDVHNLLYVYGPGSEAATVEEYGERYPGDAFVDMVGFDTYDDKASNEESYSFLKTFESVVKVTDQFAKAHNKLFAVTETGISNSAMKKTGNQRPEWFTEILDIITKPEYDCAYYMVWSNYDAKGNYYTPYVASKAEDGTLHGHELLDGFLRFYNNPKSIFAADQKEAVYGQARPAAPKITGWGDTGYITAPTAGNRILEETTVSAQLSAGVKDASFKVSNGNKEIQLETSVAGRVASAKLTADILAQLGEAANGKITLYSGEEKLAEITVIYNIPEKDPDPYLVDDFESYYGADAMLSSAWATNKASGSNITLSLDAEAGRAQEGYAMKFAYSETSGGWAGATITKEVDWSACNALQFWTIPDGKKQKAVIQIQANDTCYEVYPNQYEDYTARAGKPTLVTIPFSEFGQRDTQGNPKGGLVKDCASVSSFGLWVNAVDNEFFEGDTVSGTIWYDNITAVQTDATEVSFTDPQAEHVHAYQKVIQKATRKKNGSIVNVCAGCGDTKGKKVIYPAKSVSLKSYRFPYNQKAQKPTVTVKDAKGNRIPKAYYKVVYKNNKKPGNATVIVTLKSKYYSYKGNFKKNFEILP